MSYLLDKDVDVWVREKAELFAYSDGTEVEKRLLRAVQSSADRSVFSSELQEHIIDWASEYHFSKSRHCLLRPLGIQPGDKVLELGCGCGALTRYLGELGASVVAVEGSIHRAAIASARCSDLDNVAVYCDDLTQFECGEKFDWVLLIGVAEYAPVFCDAEDPVKVYLESASAHAAVSGSVVVAIENQLGLKYLNGCKEDHLGEEFFGVQDFYGAGTPVTFGRLELEGKLRALGFESLNLYYPFPDYKVPNVIVADSALANEQFRVSDLLVGAQARDYAGSRLRSFDEGLVYPVLERNHLIGDLSNSFLMVASNAPEENGDKAFLAASYAVNRAADFVTETRFLDSAESGIVVKKYCLVNNCSDNPSYDLGANILTHKVYHSPYIIGRQMAVSLFKVRYAAKSTQSLVDGLISWFSFLYSHAFFSGDEGRNERQGASFFLPGEFVDCTPLNLIEKSGAEIEYIDREWVCRDPVALGWVACRGVLSALQVGVSKRGADMDTLVDIVTALFMRINVEVSARDVESWAKQEAEFQSLVRYGALADSNAVGASQLFGGGGIRFAFEEVPSLDASLLAEQAIVRGLENELQVMQGTRSWRMTAPLRRLSSVVASSRQRLRRPLVVSAALMKLRLVQRKLQYSLVNEWSGARNGGVIAHFARERVKAAGVVVGRHFDNNIEWPDIDVSVLLYNSKKWIEPFFLSLREQQYPLDRINLYIVDHGSTDGTLEALADIERQMGREFSSWKILQQPNKGFGAGHDLAISEGSSPLFLVTNPDLQFDRHSIVHLVRRALSDEDSVASWECRQKPYEHPKYYDPVSMEVSWSSHACILIRRSAYDSVGGYEKKIFMYGEDVELSYRFRARGFKLRYCPQSVVWHYSYEEERQIKPLQHYGSILSNLYIRARFGNFKDIALMLPLILTLFLRPSAFPGAKRGYVSLLLSLVKNLPRFFATREAKSGFFPFRYWDYEMNREGAFHSLGSLPDVCPRVSIVVRTMEGREIFLRQALKSILNQTYPNVEIVVAQDGGDSVGSIVDGFSAKSGVPVQFLGLPKGGRSVAGNSGLDAATGDYLMFLDDDDLLFADHIEVIMCQILERDDIEAAYALAWEVFTTKSDESPNCYVESIIQTAPSHRQPFDRSLILEQNYIPIQAIIFSRKLYESAGGFNTSLDYLEDWNLWMRYAHIADFGYIEKTTSLYRTPAELVIRQGRQVLLDNSYQEAKCNGIDMINANPKTKYHIAGVTS